MNVNKLCKRYNYRPQTKLQEGYVFTAVSDSVHRGSASVHSGIPPPLSRQPPSRHPPSRHPPEQTHPPHQRTPLGVGTPQSRDPPEQTPPQSRHPPGSRHPPCAVHAGRYGQQAGGMHSTGMQSCCNNVYSCLSRNGQFLCEVMLV